MKKEIVSKNKRSELWKKICNIVSKIPRKSVIGDAPDAPSAATAIEKIYNTDLCEFAEWCSRNGWLYANYSKLWTNIGGVQKTTSQLREQWELETGRRKHNG